jgi:hypothetical protein
MAKPPDQLDLLFEVPSVQQKVLAKLKQLRSDLAHVQKATTNLGDVIARKTKSSDEVALRTRHELRGWVASLVRSVAYIERWIGSLGGGKGDSAWKILRTELDEALEKGEGKAVKDGPKK